MKKLLLTSLCLLFAGPVTPAAGIGTSGDYPPTGPGVGYEAMGPFVFPDVQLSDAFLSEFSRVQRFQDGPDEIVLFDAVLTGVASDTTFPSGPVMLTGPVIVRLVGKDDNATGTFSTEMIYMNLTGQMPDGLIIRLQESPTLPSTGQTTITDLGGGRWDVDSFFDVFTELSIDGDGGPTPSLQSVRLVLVPEPATLTLLGIGAAGVLLRRRRRR